MADSEIVPVTCSNGHVTKVPASNRIPECERQTFCITCFEGIVIPLTSDESEHVDW